MVTSHSIAKVTKKHFELWVIKLAVFVKKPALGDNRPLTVTWIKLKQLSFAVHVIQPIMLPYKQAFHTQSSTKLCGYV
jgi:hypothetical protein